LYSQALSDAITFTGEDVFGKLDEGQRNVIIDMAYNLGLPKLRGFKKFKAAKEAYISAGEKHLELKFYENARCLFSCAVLCVLLGEDAFQAAHLMKELGSKLPSTIVNSHVFQGVKLLLKARLLKKSAYLKQAERWLFHDINHMYTEDRELIERAIRETELAIGIHTFDA